VIDMGNVMRLQKEAGYAIMALDGMDITDTEESKEKAAVRAEKAEVSRKLLELADMFAMMEALVRNEYWIMKGRGFDIEVGFYDE
jgi:hypothetical protein